jgi:chemotaxis response regulator CheB
MSKSIKVTIIEDHDMTRMGLSFALSNHESIEVLGTASDGLEGVEQALELKPDLVIMDIGLPTIDGIEATRKIKNSMPEIKVLMNTSRDNERVWKDSYSEEEILELVKKVREIYGLDAPDIVNRGKASKELDTAYLSAVESGDMETAQKMVDEAAKKAGYTVKAYHGTSRGDNK